LALGEIPSYAANLKNIIKKEEKYIQEEETRPKPSRQEIKEK